MKWEGGRDVCNLYSMTSTQEAMRKLAQAFNDSIGNLPPLPGESCSISTPSY